MLRHNKDKRSDQGADVSKEPAWTGAGVTLGDEKYVMREWTEAAHALNVMV